ncbi:hypothetical protein K492DRAFT_174061 [Lichtheimia hyalospora FSU 10163]|nr:hypothetical protein K492DRAFT_174061 [Lichtheimia hyalospora FSU 10163]
MHEQHNNTNTRPRSESWGNYHDDTSSRSRFLAKLKQRQQDDMIESPSAMTLSPSPSDGCNISKQRKRPPLPMEMMQPEPFTPHHNNANCNQLSPPQESMMATPSVSKKKRSPGIRSIGRFFRSFGKHQHVDTPTRIIQMSSETPELQPAERPASPTISATRNNNNDTNNNDTDHDETFSTDDDDDASKTVVVVQKYSTLNDMQQQQSTNKRPYLRRSVSLDERSTINNNSDISFTDDPQQPADDSQIAVDRLSKRFSGGHYGSAGGLIASTLNQQDYHDDEEDEGEDTETIESESVALATPPSHSLADYPSSKNEKVQVDEKEDDPTTTTTTTTTEDDNSTKPEEYDRIASETAKRIWEQDTTVYEDWEHVAEWIGNGKPFSTSILKHYFTFFDFTNMRVDDAFRLLCGRLHLKAETQQIDRVLEEFAQRFWDCNPFSIYGNPDVVHAIVYSLLLLNTDLHVAQGDHKKMSRSAFVRNTMNAVSVQCHQQLGDAISIQEEHRASSVTLQSMESHDLKRSPSCKSASSSNNGSISRGGGGSYSFDVPSMTPMTLTFGSKSWQAEIEVSLREMYSSIKSGQILDPSLSKQETHPHASIRHTRRRSLQMSGSRVGAFKRSVGTIMLKAGRESMVLTEEPDADSTRSRSTSSFARQRRRSASVKSSVSQGSHLTNSATTYQSVAPLLHHSELPSSYTCAAPYYKEGMIVRKHLLERAGQKARHRDWRECFLVVDRAEIRTYRIDSSAAIQGGGTTHDQQQQQQQRKSMAPYRKSMIISRNQFPSADVLANQAVGGGDWLANAEPIDIIDLKHTLANALPSGYSKQRPHALALQQPNGGVYIFQAGSADQVMEWVSTCNYWAARESKEPLTGGVSSMEYGWGPCLDIVEDETLASNVYPPVTMVHEWMPDVPPTVNSNLEEKAQLETLRRHVQQLNQDLDKHRDIKPKMQQRFASCMRSQAATRAMANWENKSQYLLHETIKYQNYCDAIERSLALQDEALQQHQKEKDDN